MMMSSPQMGHIEVSLKWNNVSMCLSNSLLEQTRERQNMPGKWFQLPRIGDTPTQLKPSTIPEFWVCFVQHLPECICIHFQCRKFDLLFQLRRVHPAHTQLWALSSAGSRQDKQIYASMLPVWPSWR